MATRKTDQQLAEDHKYRLHDGRVAVSVTAISGLLDDGKSAAFAGAAVNLARQGLNYRKEWDAKAERGTRVHTHMERWLVGDEVEALPDEEGYLDGIEAFINDYDPQVVMQEAIVLSDEGYGGRFDLLADLRDPETGVRVCWLLDLKTGKQYAVEHTLQLAGYRYGDFIAAYDSDGNLLPREECQPVPEVDKVGCLYVSDDGTYEIVEYPANEEAHRQFLNLLAVHQWVRTDEIKAVVKASKTPRKTPEHEEKA